MCFYCLICFCSIFLFKILNIGFQDDSWYIILVLLFGGFLGLSFII